ncbi:MAG: hypothetical protein OES20_00380 [Gammaproteobacteria bacterium]|nr:hypothetical protein [Gammaproteobacteria bacterium]MDH3858410.1 hypothetical protein [Gammaproteobacteria bacterium]
MNTIGSHPGAILFRLSIMVILIAILTVIFFSYVDDTERELERASVLQTKKIIDSALAVVFATYATKNRLHQLNELDGGNPFVFLKEYQILPPAYVGEIGHDLSTEEIPGWYYLRHRRQVVYHSNFNQPDSYFTIVLNYQDNDKSGSYEPATDKFQSLRFVKIAEL